MRASSIWTCAGLGLALLASSGDARANADIAAGVPNALPCVYCHPDPMVTDGRDDLSSFGQEFIDLTAGMRTDQAKGLWTGGVYNIDHDMDGATSGLELGDPCGTGTVARTDDITDPSSNASTTQAEMPACSSGPSGPSGSVGAGPATPPPPFTSGICAVQGPLGGGASLPAWAGLATAVALALGLSRGRRRRDR